MSNAIVRKSPNFQEFEIWVSEEEKIDEYIRESKVYYVAYGNQIIKSGNIIHVKKSGREDKTIKIISIDQVEIEKGIIQIRLTVEVIVED